MSEATQPVAPAITIEQVTTITRQPERSFGWPTVCVRRNGELLVTCSGNRLAHVCPFGQAQL